MSLFRRRHADLGPPERSDSLAPPPAPHLLVCDDNATVTRLLEVLFEHAGWTVDVTDSGRECLQALERRVPDVIVLDQRLYFGLNGLQTAELAREGGFDRPIVLFSAHLDDTAREWAQRLDVLPVSKVDSTAVVRLVKEAHRSYRARTAGSGARERQGAASRSALGRAEALDAPTLGEAPA